MGLTRVLGISIPSCPKEVVAVLKWDRLESVTCVSPVACAGLGLTGGMSGMWKHQRAWMAGLVSRSSNSMRSRLGGLQHSKALLSRKPAMRFTRLLEKEERD